MMSGVPLETCWAFNKFWNNKFYYKVATCWLFLLIQTLKCVLQLHMWLLRHSKTVLCWMLLSASLEDCALLDAFDCGTDFARKFMADRNTNIKTWASGGRGFNPLKPELNPICYLLALLAHHFLHVSRIRVKSLTLRWLMSYIYGAPILDVSRSHTTTQHSR